MTDPLHIPLSADHPFVVALHDTWGFGADVFAAHRFWQRTDSGGVWLASRDLDPDGIDEIETVGIAVSRSVDAPDRPSTGFARRFGRFATRGVVHVDAEAAAHFAAGGALPWPEDVPRAHYCLVAGPLPGNPTEAVIGRGRLAGDQLLCEVPKRARFAAT